jgi:phosphatidylinositol glycan class S
LAAKDAIVHAEQAFFDPTMVSMLYFPAEHILAIYMPFFVPMIVPMVGSLVREVKQWRRGRAKLKTD